MMGKIILHRDHTFMTSSRWGEGGPVKNGKNSDGSGWLQEQGGEGDEIGYPQL